jgi:hypothetical protein
MLIKLLGAIMIGIYLGDKGCVVFDVFTGEPSIKNFIIIFICVGMWGTFCNVILGL